MILKLLLGFKLAWSNAGTTSCIVPPTPCHISCFPFVLCPLNPVSPSSCVPFVLCPLCTLSCVLYLSSVPYLSYLSCLMSHILSAMSHVISHYITYLFIKIDWGNIFCTVKISILLNSKSTRTNYILIMFLTYNTQ